MVDFTDRRFGRPDFEDGRDGFSMTSAGDEQHAAWEKMPVGNPAVKKNVRSYYQGQKDTQTWKEANRLASNRSQKTARKTQGRSAEQTGSASDYALTYEDHLANVLSTKGTSLAKQFGEIKPGRG